MGKTWMDQYGLLGGGWEGALAADIRRAYGSCEGTHWQRVLGCCRSAGVQAMVVLRFGQWALECPRWARIVLDPVYVVLDLAIKIVWGIDVPRRAVIGAGLRIAHFGGVTVSPLAVIGRRCSLEQDVLVGAKQDGDAAPVMGDDVSIGAGARVLGGIRIGDRVHIGPNSVVLEDIPENARVELDPGFRIVEPKSMRLAAQLRTGAPGEEEAFAGLLESPARGAQAPSAPTTAGEDASLPCR